MKKHQTILWLIWLAVVIGVLWFCARMVHGAAVRLAWDPSPSTNRILDYEVYWGPATRFYTNHFHAGTNLTATITNLLPGRTYYFTATATDDYGQESGYSAEVFTTTPLSPTNVVTVFLLVQTNSRLANGWSNYLALPVYAITNPPAPTFFQTQMGISNWGPARKVLRVDSHTMVFTNK